MSVLQRIVIDPEQCGERPCIQKLRISTSDVLDLRASGATREEIFPDYPSLEDADISAVPEYTARQLNHRVLRIAEMRFLVYPQLPPSLARWIAYKGSTGRHRI